MNDGPESERLAKAVFYGTVLLVAWIMWRVVQPFAAEIGWAVVLAVCLNPIRMRVEPRFGRTKTALLLVLAVLVVVVVPMVFVGHTLYDSGESGVHYVQRRLSDEGRYLSASPLHPAATATCVRVRGGRRVITDGPFAETHEVLGGYYLILAEDRATAVRFAAQHPGARVGTVEVRPLFDVSGVRKAT